MLAAGKLSERVTLQAPAETRGAAYSDVKKAWADVATVWAAFEPLSGRELLLAQQVNSEITVRFRLRYRADITAKWRVIYRGRVFQIAAPPIDVGGRGVELHLQCVETRVG
jgi:SPP1 family predicted phage head-tail adaptor